MMLLSTMNTNYAKLCILSHIGKLNQPWHIIIFAHHLQKDEKFPIMKIPITFLFDCEVH